MDRIHVLLRLWEVYLNCCLKPELDPGVIRPSGYRSVGNTITLQQLHFPRILLAIFHVSRPLDLEISLPAPTAFSMSTRSYHGCWTCKRRRRRCDNTRPQCQNCTDRGMECEGYEVRLRWGCGIASRGQFTGADKPLKESVPPRPKGRRRDLSRERKRLEAQNQSQTPSSCQTSENTRQPNMIECLGKMRKRDPE